MKEDETGRMKRGHSRDIRYSARLATENVPFLFPAFLFPVLSDQLRTWSTQVGRCIEPLGSGGGIMQSAASTRQTKATLMPV